MRYDTKLISKAVAEAIAYGEQFKDTDDGGTCNFDSCVIYVPGLREDQARRIPNTSLFTSGWQGRTLHLHGTRGQGFRRTKMAEAQNEFLKAHYPALQVGMYYQMD